MSNSQKDQKGRQQTQGATSKGERLPVAKEAAAPSRPIEQALYERIVAGLKAAGIQREEGPYQVWLHNGATLALKYTEDTTGKEAPMLLVAAFRQGVVFQVRDNSQVIYTPGEWEKEIEAIQPEPAAGFQLNATTAELGQRRVKLNPKA